jgi:hypothetical protein
MPVTIDVEKALPPTLRERIGKRSPLCATDDSVLYTMPYWMVPVKYFERLEREPVHELVLRPREWV